MTTVKTAEGGVDYLIATLKEKPNTITRVCFWKIPHSTPAKQEDIQLKIGRYKRSRLGQEDPENLQPKSELTLDSEEFQSLLGFLSQNYEPFRTGVKRYIPVGDELDEEDIERLRAIFTNPDKQEVLGFIVNNKILPNDLITALQTQARSNAVKEFENMLSQDLPEQSWQDWFKENDWVLGSEFVRILDERAIDTSNISDYLMQAYDGFLDIIEIKRPEGDLRFWAAAQDHGNHDPSRELTMAIVQATTYLYEVEREANSAKFQERVGHVKVIKPRSVLIFGRSNDWDSKQREAYRILNSSYHNLTIMTYDHVLDRAKRMVMSTGT